MDSFKPFIAKAATGVPLSASEAKAAFDAILSGEVTPAQAAGFLMALRVRGETVGEIEGAVAALRSRMVRVTAPADAIDIVGTGGDNAGTYNVSTLAALIVAACGVPVAKHGNRAASSLSGAADVLTALGVKVGLDAGGIERCLTQTGIGFMFAPAHHASMRNVAPVRVELGTRTIFNLIGPMSNPAGVRRQLLGAFAESWLEPMANVLNALGSERVWAVHGSDGLDEITTTGPTRVVALDNGKISQFTINPEDAGLQRVTLDQLRGGSAEVNARALMEVVEGAATPYRDIALLNAAASLVVSGKATSLPDGADAARAALSSGAVKGVLTRLIAVSNA